MKSCESTVTGFAPKFLKGSQKLVVAGEVVGSGEAR